MVIFINAVALKAAGARSVALNFLKSITTSSNLLNGHSLYAAVPDQIEYRKVLENTDIRVFYIPNKFNEPIFRYFIDHVYLKRLIKKIAPAVIFSMGNISLPIKDIPQLLLFHLPQVVYPEVRFWEKTLFHKIHFSILRSQVKRKLKYATCIAAQTLVAKKRLDALFGVGYKSCVIPNAVSLQWNEVEGNTQIGNLRALKKEGEKIFICLSRYYLHKNLEIFISVAVNIKSMQLPYKIVLTINEEQDTYTRRLMSVIREKGLDEIVINIGPVLSEQVPNLYNLSDALILPTLLESFSGTYVESAYFQKPIFTADRDFAREICEEYAIYFDPLNAIDIVDKMKLIEDEAFITDITERGYNVMKNKYPSWPVVGEMYFHKLLEIGRHNDSDSNNTEKDQYETHKDILQ